MPPIHRPWRLVLVVAFLGLGAWIARPLGGQTPAGTSADYPPDAVFRAFAEAYPDQAQLRNPLEGPVLMVSGTAFHWAEGRLLPWERRRDWAAWAPQPFYPYPQETPDVGAWSADQLAAAEQRLADRRADQPQRDPAFFDALWGIHNRAEADQAQRQIRFLGLPLTIHQDLQGPLARVEARLSAERGRDPTLEAFLRTLIRLEGFNWRVIAGTKSRSNHAYGTAVDLIPRTYGAKNPYWLWAHQDDEGWYRAAWRARWLPHPALIRAFEAEGFVWGGKWLLFDTIHFEYRPEILILSHWPTTGKKTLEFQTPGD